MQKRRSRKRGSWVADFETTTDANDCRVWSWFLVDINGDLTVDDVEVGTDLNSFVDRISERDEIVYFHNLKFDGTFIIDWLFREGYAHRDKAALPGEFSTLISSMGAFYTVTVHWENGKKTEFRDSLKKLPFSVARIGEAFKLDVAKGEIDYHAPRPIGHVITPEERHYGSMDVLVVAKALKLEFDSGMDRLTVGSDSLYEFKSITGSKMFGKLYPVLPDSTDAHIRAAYKGGFTYADVRFKGSYLGSGSTYDVNSLYPSVMYDSLLPYGEPLFRFGKPSYDPEYPLYIISITFTAVLKKDHIPCIQVKNSGHFSATVYQERIDEVITLSVSNVDLELWERHYDMNILSYNGGYYFKGRIGAFNNFINKWMKVKKESEGGMRELAKLHLNSLY